jgi:23S rRNA maturation-related 3'-5' exoribonuclease YhaM
LWFIYHDNPSNPNIFMQYYVEDIESQYNTVFNSIMTSIDKEITSEQEDNVHRTTSIAFDELQDKINRLFFEMSESIRKGNVGNLRKGKRGAHR